MGLDIRTPIGLMFSIFGLLLGGYGLLTRGSEIYARSAGLNNNLGWGLVLLVPDAPRQGIVINLASMRLFHYSGKNRPVLTYPVGIGEEGRSTPMGTMFEERKTVRPTWYVPASIGRDHAQRGDPLPAEVPPGPDNPLGEYALYLSRTSYVIHGTNKPYSIGLRATNGCIRLYPEDVEKLYRTVPVKTPVYVVNQPYLVGRAGGMLYLEAHAPQEELNAADVKKKLYARLKDIEKKEALRLDWKRVEETVTQARGIPVPILEGGGGREGMIAAAVEIQRPVQLTVKVSFSYTNRVSPVVADVVPYELLMFPAVLTEMGEAFVPEENPFLDTTGPVKVVVAIDGSSNCACCL